MDPVQERELRRSMREQSKTLQGRAKADPRPTSRGGTFQEVAPPAQPRSKTAVEPYAPPPPESAEDMGGAVDQGGPPIRFGPSGERISAAPSGPFSTEDANNLVAVVRQGRQARGLASQRLPTFGEVATQTREAAAAVPPPPAPAPDETAIARSIRFLVDTRTGEFEPVMPDQPEPSVGPNDILMTVGEDPSQPNILAQGKRVTPAALARLGDPKRAIQPALRKGFKIPEQYAGLAKALGVEENVG